MANTVAVCFASAARAATNSSCRIEGTGAAQLSALTRIFAGNLAPGSSRLVRIVAGVTYRLPIHSFRTLAATAETSKVEARLVQIPGPA